MKVPPKRKGNRHRVGMQEMGCFRLNESPSEKEGKYRTFGHSVHQLRCLNESPSEKEGKSGCLGCSSASAQHASMKVPPKRKGNFDLDDLDDTDTLPQ